jgi:hypothetical protein
MRKRNWLVALAALAVVVAAGVVTLRPRADRITQENCDRIRKGMTLADVVGILGPPGDYRTGPAEIDLPDCIMPVSGVVIPPWAVWKGDHGGIYLYRNGDYRDPAIEDHDDDDPESVWCAEFIEVEPINQSPLASLLWHAKRLWHRWFPE